MKDPIYYYKTISGRAHFSNGQIKDETKFGQYIRMLRYAKYPVEPLYLDNPEDFIVIKNLFHLGQNVTWQDIYYEK